MFIRTMYIGAGIAACEAFHRKEHHLPDIRFHWIPTHDQALIYMALGLTLFLMTEVYIKYQTRD